jgi:hypothetical protein
VIERVIAKSVPRGKDIAKGFRVFSHVVTDAKESCLGFHAGQLTQNEIRWTRHGAIIKSEIDYFIRGGNSPYELRIKPAK